MVRLHSEMAKVNAECKHLTFRRIAASIVERKRKKRERSSFRNFRNCWEALLNFWDFMFNLSSQVKKASS